MIGWALSPAWLATWPPLSMVLRLMRILGSVLVAAFLVAAVSPALSAPESRRKATAVSSPSLQTEAALKAGAPKRGKVDEPSKSPTTQGGKAKGPPNSSPGKISCQVERICQEMKRPVREVVTVCSMIKPSPDSPPRRLCTEKVASGERAGPELCRSAKICKAR
ncbi:conserved hypothetical protein [Hyphomicrobiales bacterium]|nr:conserved hypothetical protein [Hyphomicrobiales bacterium]CAH1670979.1 conserved hypothetical protein [Hyphomicrobiales bacterium]